MCSSFTWGIVSVHYLLGLPLAYALRSSTPNGLMLLVKLTYSPVMLRPIDSFYFPRCSILSPSSLAHCVLFTPLPHDTLSCSIFRLVHCVLFTPLPHDTLSCSIFRLLCALLRGGRALGSGRQLPPPPTNCWPEAPWGGGGGGV